MSWITGSLIFFLIWWLVLFTVLPWGVQRADRPGRGHDPGAPRRAKMLMKVGATTVIAAVLWAAVYVVMTYDLITLSAA